MEIVYLITLVVITALRVWFFESKQDFYIIKDSKGLFKRQWKFWGNANEMSSMVIPVALITILVAWQAVFLFPIMWITWWIAHDFAMGYRLGKGIWYIGETGFDGEMKAMFQRSGVLYFVLGKLVWLGVFVSLYLGL
jgi:hypothetical protein